MLHGVRVVDLTRVLAGPLASMSLGDLGAQVIKIERPQLGDESRGWGPPFDSRGESAYYLSANRNKLSIALDLSESADRDLLRGLIAGADIVLDNFLKGSLERLGLDVNQLLSEHPRLIWCTLTGFGPDSYRPGYDFVVQAESGWMAITGEPTGEPMKVGVALADVLAGKDTTIAVLAALAARANGELTVQRRRLFTSLSASAEAALVNVAQNALVSGEQARRWGNAHANLVPYQLFHAKDRAMVVAVGNDSQWLACCKALGLNELAEDASLRTNRGRLAGRERVTVAIRERLVTEPAAYWVERLMEAGVPTGLIREVSEVITAGHGSPLTGMAPSVPGEVRLPPPRLDEHGALIRAHGWGAFELVR